MYKTYPAFKCKKYVSKSASYLPVITVGVKQFHSPSWSLQWWVSTGRQIVWKKNRSGSISMTVTPSRGGVQQLADYQQWVAAMTHALTLLPFCWSLSGTGRYRLLVQQIQHRSGTRLAAQWSIHRRSLWREKTQSEQSADKLKDRNLTDTFKMTYKLWPQTLPPAQSANNKQSLIHTH